MTRSCALSNLKEASKGQRGGREGVTKRGKERPRERFSENYGGRKGWKGRRFRSVCKFFFFVVVVILGHTHPRQFYLWN